MIITRRQLIGSGLTILFSKLLPFVARAGSVRTTTPLLINFTDIRPDIDIQNVQIVVSSLIKNGISFSLSVCPLTKNGKPLAPNSELAAWLRKLHGTSAEHVEIALQLMDQNIVDSGNTLYDQMRNTSYAHNLLIQALNPLHNSDHQALGTSFSMTLPNGHYSKFSQLAVRAAGIRTLFLNPGKDYEKEELHYNDFLSGYRLNKNGVLEVFSSHPDDVPPQPPSGWQHFVKHLDQKLERPSPSARPTVATLSSEVLASQTRSVVEAFASQLAKQLATLTRRAQLLPMRPRDFYRSSTQHPLHYVVVRIDGDHTVSGDNSLHREIIDEMLAAQIPLSYSVAPVTYAARLVKPFSKHRDLQFYLINKLQHSRFDIMMYGYPNSLKEITGKSASELQQMLRNGLSKIAGLGGPAVEGFISSRNITDLGSSKALAQVGFRTLSTHQGNTALALGVDKQGVFSFSNTINLEGNWAANAPDNDVKELLVQLEEANDVVLAIRSHKLVSRSNARKVAKFIGKLSREPRVALVNFRQYRRMVMPRLLELDLLQESRYRQSTKTPAYVKKGTEYLHEELLRDAASAWLFFTQNGNFPPGLVPAATWKTTDGYGHYPILTMWDLGSIILATISAYSIGLINRREFRKRIDGALTFLSKAEFRYNKAVLPNYRTNLKTGLSEELGYDATDTGRLLVALHVLKKCAKGLFDADKITNRWNIDATIKNGTMHDVKNGRLIESESNIYRYYISRGYDFFDLVHRLAYNDPRPLRDMDSIIKFLSEVKEIGPIATEPSVTEGLEIGFSEHAQIISDVMFAAQVRRYERTGKITCISETPIDRNPWFTYQGFMLDDSEGAWTVHSVVTEERWQNQRFEESNRMINSKAAYMWLAARPDPYSEIMYRYIRENTRTGHLGFAPGVYEESKKPPNVFDVNTNGAILESIAYILAGRKPLSDLVLI